MAFMNCLEQVGWPPVTLALVVKVRHWEWRKVTVAGYLPHCHGEMTRAQSSVRKTAKEADKLGQKKRQLWRVPSTRHLQLPVSLGYMADWPLSPCGTKHTNVCSPTLMDEIPSWCTATYKNSTCTPLLTTTNTPYCAQLNNSSLFQKITGSINGLKIWNADSFRQKTTPDIFISINTLMS